MAGQICTQQIIAKVVHHNLSLLVHNADTTVRSRKGIEEWMRASVHDVTNLNKPRTVPTLQDKRFAFSW